MIIDTIVSPVIELIINILTYLFKTNLLHRFSRRLEYNWCRCDLPRSEKYHSTVQYAFLQYSTDHNMDAGAGL